MECYSIEQIIHRQSNTTMMQIWQFFLFLFRFSFKKWRFFEIFWASQLLSFTFHVSRLNITNIHSKWRKFKRSISFRLLLLSMRFDRISKTRSMIIIIIIITIRYYDRNYLSWDCLIKLTYVSFVIFFFEIFYRNRIISINFHRRQLAMQPLQYQSIKMQSYEISLKPN